MQFTADEIQEFANKVSQGEDLTGHSDVELRRFSRMVYCARMSVHMNSQQITQSGEAIRAEMLLRFIQKLDRRNFYITCALGVVSITALIASVIQAGVSIETRQVSQQQVAKQQQAKPIR